MALPKTGITTKLVASTIGVGSNDVGTLCSSQNINMWSRAKPVHIYKSIAPDRNSNWWKGTSGTCGISLTNASTQNYKLIPSMYTTDLKNGWEYQPPNGGENSPYRLYDFMYYDHNAFPPFLGFVVTGKVKEEGLLNAMISYAPTTDGEKLPGSVSLDDISATATTLNYYYFGIVVTDKNGNFKGRVTSSTKGDLRCSYDVSSLTLGSSYYVYPFLARESMEQMQTDVANNFYTLPNVEKAEFKVVTASEADGLTILLTATYVYNQSTGIKNGISCTINLTAENTGRTLTSNQLSMRFSNNDPMDTIQAGESYMDLGTIELTANNTTKITKNFTISSAYAQKSYYVYLSLQRGAYTRRTVPMEILPTSNL